MHTTLDAIIDHLTKARGAATLESSSFGFPNDKIQVVEMHFGGKDHHTGIGRGDTLHPDDYIRRTVAIHHRSWIIGPLDQALSLLEQNRQLVRQCDALREQLSRSNIPALLELARAGMKQD